MYPVSVALKSLAQPAGVGHTALTPVHEFGRLLKGASETNEMGLIHMLGTYVPNI